MMTTKRVHRDMRAPHHAGSHGMLSPIHPEWARMWESLFDIAGSYTDHNPASGEYWQYTGTIWVDRPAIGSGPLQVLVHQFRHRDRPKTARANSWTCVVTRPSGAERLRDLGVFRELEPSDSRGIACLSRSGGPANLLGSLACDPRPGFCVARTAGVSPQ